MFLRQAGPVTGLTAIHQGTMPLDLMRIVAVDTWLDELDRKKPLRGEWSLLSDASVRPARVVAIDYGMCLTELLGPPILGQITMEARVPEEWRPWLQVSDIPAAIA